MSWLTVAFRSPVAEAVTDTSKKLDVEGHVSCALKDLLPSSVDMGVLLEVMGLDTLFSKLPVES